MNVCEFAGRLVRDAAAWGTDRKILLFCRIIVSGARGNLANRDSQIWQSAFDLRHRQLTRVTERLVGSEIEKMFIDALHEAFSRRDEPSDLSIAMLLHERVPPS